MTEEELHEKALEVLFSFHEGKEITAETLAAPILQPFFPSLIEDSSGNLTIDPKPNDWADKIIKERFNRFDLALAKAKQFVREISEL